MLDPFQKRYGPIVAAWLYVPALMGEVFWTAAILTALGVSFEVIAGIPFTPGVILSAVVAIAYTARSGLWAVAITDVVQLALLLIGLSTAAGYAIAEVGGATLAWTAYSANEIAEPPTSWIPWSDSALLLIFGGIPWPSIFNASSQPKAPQMRVDCLYGLVVSA
jgi:high affinity choline transporter 7